MGFGDFFLRGGIQLFSIRPDFLEAWRARRFISKLKKDYSKLVKIINKLENAVNKEDKDRDEIKNLLNDYEEKLGKTAGEILPVAMSLARFEEKVKATQKKYTIALNKLKPLVSSKEDKKWIKQHDARFDECSKLIKQADKQITEVFATLERDEEALMRAS